MDATYLQALKTYLESQFIADPPALATLGEVSVGRYQDDPQGNPAVVSLHSGDPEDQAYNDQQLSGGFKYSGNTNTNYLEIGGGGVWEHQYTAHVAYYMTLTGENQDEARSKSTDLLDWLERKILAAQPGVLGISTIHSQTMMQVIVVSRRTQEGGGPPNTYLWRSRLRWTAIVYHG